MQRMFCQERVAFNISHVLWFSFQILLFLIWPKVLEKGRISFVIVLIFIKWEFFVMDLNYL